MNPELNRTKSLICHWHTGEMQYIPIPIDNVNGTQVVERGVG